MKKSLTSLFILIVIIAVIATVLVFKTSYGQTLLNHYKPTIARTLSLQQSADAKIAHNVHLASLDYYGNPVTIDSTTLGKEGTYYIDYTTWFTYKKSTASTTSQKTAGYFTDSEIFIRDPFDGTYAKHSDTATPWWAAELLRDIADGYIQKQMLSTTTSLQASSTVITLSNTIHFNNLGDIPVILEIDSRSYGLNKIIFKGNAQNNDRFLSNIVVNITPSNESPTIPTTVPNDSFGDFRARESVYLRTNTNGDFDYLWPLWEQKYFGCTECIDRYGDADVDGLTNMQEFILNTNPRITMPGLADTSTVSEKIDAIKADITGPTGEIWIVSTPYSDAIKKIIFGPGDYTYDNALTRSPGFSLYIPVTTTSKFLEVDYDYEPSATNTTEDFITTFINESLVNKINLASSSAFSKKIYYDLSAYQNKKPILSLVLNTVGKKTDVAATINVPGFLKGAPPASAEIIVVPYVSKPVATASSSTPVKTSTPTGAALPTMRFLFAESRASYDETTKSITLESTNDASAKVTAAHFILTKKEGDTRVTFTFKPITMIADDQVQFWIEKDNYWYTFFDTNTKDEKVTVDIRALPPGTYSAGFGLYKNSNGLSKVMFSNITTDDITEK